VFKIFIQKISLQMNINIPEFITVDIAKCGMYRICIICQTKIIPKIIQIQKIKTSNPMHLFNM
jgi:hypothetical protein